MSRNWKDDKGNEYRFPLFSDAYAIFELASTISKSIPEDETGIGKINYQLPLYGAALGYCLVGHIEKKPKTEKLIEYGIRVFDKLQDEYTPIDLVLMAAEALNGLNERLLAVTESANMRDFSEAPTGQPTE